MYVRVFDGKEGGEGGMEHSPHAVVLPQAVPKVNHPTLKIKENHTTWKISSSVVGIMIDLASCSDRAQQ